MTPEAAHPLHPPETSPGTPLLCWRCGKAVTRFGSEAVARALALQSDGRIVAAGGGNVEDFGVARYTSRGTLDRSFGQGGRVTTNLGYRYGSASSDTADALAIQRDGRIIVAGATDLRGSCGERSSATRTTSRSCGKRPTEAPTGTSAGTASS